MLRLISAGKKGRIKICKLFNQFLLEAAYPVQVNELAIENSSNPWFWLFNTSRESLKDSAFTFSVFVDEKNHVFTIDSGFNNSTLSTTSRYDYIYNYMIWSCNASKACSLLIDCVKKFTAIPFTTVPVMLKPGTLFFKIVVAFPKRIAKGRGPFNKCAISVFNKMPRNGRVAGSYRNQMGLRNPVVGYAKGLVVVG